MTPGPFALPAAVTFHTRNQTRAACTLCEWSSPWCPNWWNAKDRALRHRDRAHPEIVKALGATRG